MGVWSPILIGFSNLVVDKREPVQVAALTSLFSLIAEHFYSNGVVNEPLAALKTIFRDVMLPIFGKLEAEGGKGGDVGGAGLPPDYISYTRGDGYAFLGEGSVALSEKRRGSQGEWLATSFNMAMDTCISLMAKGDEALHDGALRMDTLSILVKCIGSNCCEVACSALDRLSMFIFTERQGNLGEDEWNCISDCLSGRVKSCLGGAATPDQSEGSSMSGDEGDGDLCNAPFSCHVIAATAHTIGLLLCKIEYVPLGAYQSLLGALQGAVSVYEKREDGARRSILADDQQVRPEEACLYCRKVMVEVLLRLAKVGGDGDVQDMLTNITRNLCSAYVMKDARAQAGENGKLVREVASLKELIKVLLEGYGNFEDNLLLKNIWLLPLLSKLIECSDKNVRVTVHQIVSRLFEGPLSDLLKISEAGAK